MPFSQIIPPSPSPSESKSPFEIASKYCILDSFVYYDG